MPTASNQGIPEVFPFSVMKLSHSCQTLSLYQSSRDDGWLPCNSKLWIDTLCLFSFGCSLLFNRPEEWAHWARQWWGKDVLGDGTAHANTLALACPSSSLGLCPAEPRGKGRHSRDWELPPYLFSSSSTVIEHIYGQLDQRYFPVSFAA